MSMNNIGNVRKQLFALIWPSNIFKHTTRTKYPLARGIRNKAFHQSSVSKLILPFCPRSSHLARTSPSVAIYTSDKQKVHYSRLPFRLVQRVSVLVVCCMNNAIGTNHEWKYCHIDLDTHEIHYMQWIALCQVQTKTVSKVHTRALF